MAGSTSHFRSDKLVSQRRWLGNPFDLWASLSGAVMVLMRMAAIGACI